MKSKLLITKIFSKFKVVATCNNKKKNNVFIVIKFYQFDYSRIFLSRFRRRDDNENIFVAFEIIANTTIFDVFDVFVKVFLIVLSLKYRSSYFFTKFLQLSHVDFDFQ